jgi:tRNA pseudouridine55 synthase
VHGVLVVDKPEGVSSAHAVERVKHALHADRAGHGGTLDPMATGVLAICLGEATKLASYLLADDKEYTAEGLLGIETDTLDRTGKVTAERSAADVTREALLAAIAGRMGAQDQVPPMYSAIKQDGVRLYRRARAGEEVERAPRKIRIDRLDLIAFAPPRFTLAIACSKGTYVRSLVADLGSDVGCGAHLTALRRTRSGKFTIEQAIRLDQVGVVDVEPHLVALTAATDLPTIVISAEKDRHARNGVQFSLEQLGAENLQQFQMVDQAGELLAVVHAVDGKVIYDRVFHRVRGS